MARPRLALPGETPNILAASSRATGAGLAVDGSVALSTFASNRFDGHVRQRGGNSDVVEVAVDHAAKVEIWVGAILVFGGVSSVRGSV